MKNAAAHLSHEARPISVVTSAHFARAVPNRCTLSVRIAAANSCAVRVGKTKNYRATVLAAPDLRPVSGVIRCLCQLVHKGEERRGLADEEPHVR